jgi:pyruvate/2-oxoglutarate dehydrogenase complex dihydrolipoamide acyltransferase (E2) component
MSKMTTRRKLAIATWSAPREGNIYGKVTLDASAVQQYLEHHRQQSGEKLTITHFVGKAVGQALRAVPSLNGRIVLGRYVPHEVVDVAFLVVLGEGTDLAKAKVQGMDRKSVVEVARELRELAERLRAGRDEQFEKSKGLLRMLPTWLIRPVLRLSGYLTGALGIELKALGLEAFPFGSAIVTSVGMMGVDEGFAPPTPFARVPLYVLVGALREQPAVVKGELCVLPQVTLCATLDHRFVDGFQAGQLLRVVRSLFDDPWQLDGQPAASALPDSRDAGAAPR